MAVGFAGAVVLDHAFGDDAHAAPPPSTTTAPSVDPPRRIPNVVIGDPIITPRASLTASSQAQSSSSSAAASAALSSASSSSSASAALVWSSARTQNGAVVADYGGRTATLTREAALEARVQKLVDDARVPYAATVLLEPSTGRVLAVAESSTRGDAHGLAFKPMAKAASVFKVVTTSALLEAGVSPDDKVCMHGGKTRMQPALLVDNGRRDHTCTTLGDALPRSQNVAIAKLALKHLDPTSLRAQAAKWGFDRPLPTDVVVDAGVGAGPSPTQVPDDPFGFANAAAGFGDVKLSAMHGALLASIVANGGMLVPPVLVDAVDGDADAPAPHKPTRVVDAAVARALQEMMRDTVQTGTARKQFTAAPRLTIPAAGKTGSLADYDTGLETTWFIGYAPADRPEVVVASVMVNTATWTMKAPTAAKEALRAYFAAHPSTRPSGVVARK